MQDLILRESTKNDSEFFIKLFGEIKNSELHLETWTEPIKSQLISMQYNAFIHSITNEFPRHIDYLILFQSDKAGRLQLDKNVNGYRIINISLLPSFQNKGIGTEIIKNIITEANQKDIPVLLEVDRINPAQNLYFRLGFKVIQQDEIKFSMKYTPK